MSNAKPLMQQIPKVDVLLAHPDLAEVRGRLTHAALLGLPFLNAVESLRSVGLGPFLFQSETRLIILLARRLRGSRRCSKPGSTTSTMSTS